MDINNFYLENNLINHLILIYYIHIGNIYVILNNISMYPHTANRSFKQINYNIKVGEMEDEYKRKVVQFNLRTILHGFIITR